MTAFIYGYLATAALLMMIYGLLLGSTFHRELWRLAEMAGLHAGVFWSLCLAVSWVRSRWFSKPSGHLTLGAWDIALTFALLVAGLLVLPTLALRARHL